MEKLKGERERGKENKREKRKIRKECHVRYKLSNGQYSCNMLISAIIIDQCHDIAPVIDNISYTNTNDQQYEMNHRKYPLLKDITRITQRKGRRKELYFHNAKEFPFAILRRIKLLSLFLPDHCPNPRHEFLLFCNST